MTKPGDGTINSNFEARVQLQTNEKQVFDLLDEIHDLEQFRREQLVLRKLSSYLKSSLTKREAHSAIECFGPQLWPGATGAVYLIHETAGFMERVATWGGISLTEPSLAWQDCWAMRHLQPHCVQSSSSELLCQHIAQSPSALPSICIPLLAHGQKIGLLHLQGLRNNSLTTAPSHPAVALAVAVGEDLGLAHANMRLRDSLREQSIKDALTGLFNRRFVDEFLVQELARAERKTRQLSMIALDIDHFKRINDTFGHGAGDTVLQNVGTILRAHIRGSDIASRVGGEEFLVLLSESPLALATARAENIRNAISGMSLKYESKELGRITASFGAVAFPDHGRTADALIRAADKALYDAKNGGRNQVVSAPLLN